MEQTDNSHIYGQLRRLIAIVDELRDVGLHHYINLPRICVVGTQSSGKSSVLESIMGLDFLPRGEGVVTRRPIELRLVHLSETAYDKDEWWVEFENEKNKKYKKFEEVRAHIQHLTDAIAGVRKGIIDEPLVLTVYSTQCPDLSLVDLPGITRVPLKDSDQGDDIEKTTREMTLRYAEDPRTIVLAVLPANADMSTSDALQMARKVDSRGMRTIGVITKIDLMDRGRDARSMLQGEDVPLRLGYTGLINRSQADIREGVTITQAIQKEKKFFSGHPIYCTLPHDLYGISSLVSKLTTVLFRHIKGFLPEIKAEMNNRVRSVESRLEELGKGVPSGDGPKSEMIWTMVTDFCVVYRNIIKGKYDKRLRSFLSSDESYGGDQLRSIFNELMSDFVEHPVTTDMSNYDIDLAIRMHEGDALPGFPSPDTFEFLILPHLTKIIAPIFDTLDRATQYLELLSQRVIHRIFGRFPELADQMLQLFESMLAREKEKTRQILDDIVQAESGYLFTNDYSYLSAHGGMIPTGDEGKKGPASPPPEQTMDQKARDMYKTAKEKTANLWAATNSQKKNKYTDALLNEIRRRLDNYFNLIVKNLRDSIPKAVGTFLVRRLLDDMQFELYNGITAKSHLGSLMKESEEVAEEREILSKQLCTLKRAGQVLLKDPHISAMFVASSELADLGPAEEISLPNPSSPQSAPRSYFPPTNNPPTNNPPTNNPPTNNPPTNNPPTNYPPKNNPPTNNPSPSGTLQNQTPQRNRQEAKRAVGLFSGDDLEPSAKRLFDSNSKQGQLSSPDPLFGE